MVNVDCAVDRAVTVIAPAVVEPLKRSGKHCHKATSLPQQGLPVLKAFCTAGGDLTAFERRFFSNCDMAGWTEEEGLCALPAILDDDSLAAFITIPRGDHATFQQTHVGEETRAVEEKRKKAEESLKRMEAARKEAQVSMAGIRGRITGKFARLRKVLDEDEREALHCVAVKERELLSRIEEDIARHKREIGELQAAAARLRNLQHEMDSLAFLQERDPKGICTPTAHFTGHHHDPLP
ncbi:unnamed protein product [Lampetra planeri]